MWKEGEEIKAIFLFFALVPYVVTPRFLGWRRLEEEEEEEEVAKTLRLAASKSRMLL